MEHDGSEPLEMPAVCAYYVEQDGRLVSMVENYPLVEGHLYSDMSLFVNPAMTRERLAESLRQLADTVACGDGFYIDSVDRMAACERPPGGRLTIRPLGGEGKEE